MRYKYSYPEEKPMPDIVCKYDPGKDVEVAKVIAEHYQKTFEFTYDYWKERNKNFLILLGIIGVEILLINRENAGLNHIALEIYATYIKRCPVPSESPEAGFPFNLLISILIVVIFYLIIQIYQKTSYINRSYQYLKDVEGEIVQVLKKDNSSNLTAFTREGNFYKNHKDFFRKTIGIVYASILEHYY